MLARHKSDHLLIGNIINKATICWILISHPPPTRKMHPQEFCHYTITPFCACAICDVTIYCGCRAGRDFEGATPPLWWASLVEVSMVSRCSFVGQPP